MGIADRDYARPATRHARVGRLRMLSVNTWIIIINIVVFLIGNVAMNYYDPQTRRVETRTVRISAGTVHYMDVTPEQIKREKSDQTRLLAIPDMPGYFGYPLYDPDTAVRDARAVRSIFVPTLPGPPRLITGWQRYTMAPPLHAWGHFSTGKAFLEFQVWRFVTFQFLHADFGHIAFNMLGLWFVGGLVEEYLGRRRYLAFYLACGVFGAVSYLILNFLGYIILTYVSPTLRDSLPALLFDDIYTQLIGASAGVFGVLMAAAYIAPSAIVDVMFILPMRLRTAVYIFLGLAVLNLLRHGQNAGGDAAHVGGAIAGALLIRRPHLLRDFFDILGDSRRSKPRPPDPEAKTVDRILDKIRSHGLESLTPAEREILRRESQAARERYLD